MALTSQQQAIQNKIDALDSASSTDTMLSLLTQAIDEGGIRWGYDSESFYPGFDSAERDSDYIGMFAYHDGDSDLWYYGQDRIWHKMDSAASSDTPASAIQGSNFGYSLGGRQPAFTNTIEKYSYSTDGNATDVADLTAAFAQHITTYSATDAFTHGGYNPAERANVDKFNFASAANATDFGDHPGTGRYGGATSSPTHGYIHGGNSASSSYGAPGQRHITKFPHSADTLSTTLVSENGISAATRYNETNASETHGYVSSIGPGDNKIEKYSFTTDGAATDVGDLLDTTNDGRGAHSGLMSDVLGGYGYVNMFPPSIYQLSRYSFVSDGNATDYADLNNNVWLGSVSASTTSGYLAGGLTPPPASYINYIQKFPFASASNATDVGDLSASRGYNGGAAN